jgi:hypothetical protein
MKALTIILTALFLLFSELSPTWSGNLDTNLKFEGQNFSANLKKASLKAVLRKIESRKGIWFKGRDSLLDREISVQFRNLSLQDGLKRILFSTNYCLVFDHQRKLSGVILIGGGHQGRSSSEVGASSKKQSNVSPRAGKKSSPRGGSSNLSPKELEKFKVVKNSPPPSAPPQSVNKDPGKFKVIRNSPPPGGTGKQLTDKDLEKFKVIKNSPPPGD